MVSVTHSSSLGTTRFNCSRISLLPGAWSCAGVSLVPITPVLQAQSRSQPGCHGIITFYLLLASTAAAATAASAALAASVRSHSVNILL
jgi:hypothetical protein